MRQEYQKGLDALDPTDKRWPTAARSAGFKTAEERNDAMVMGLGSAVVARRTKLKAARAKVKAARKHSKRTR